MAFWDDLTDFGSGLLDDVGEGMGNLIDVATRRLIENAATTQQPQQTVKDNHDSSCRFLSAEVTTKPFCMWAVLVLRCFTWSYRGLRKTNRGELCH
ncbi:hypothetical protein O9929_01415 [Vibrio lentus]|nr:hypothetical protein [Vibrio lentus]